MYQVVFKFQVVFKLNIFKWAVLLEHLAFPADWVYAARLAHVVRRGLLNEYKLRPMPLHFDRLAYFEVSCEPSPEVHLSFGAFLARHNRISMDSLKFDFWRRLLAQVPSLSSVPYD